MAGRVNTRFVILLSSVIVVLVGAVAGIYVFKVMRSAEELIRQGDMYVAQDNPRMALEKYGRAVSKRPTDVELLQKYVDTLRTINATDIVEARKYLGQIQSATRQASEVDPTNEELLADYYELQRSLSEQLFGRGGYDELHRLASIKIQSYPDNLTAHKYRGLAQVHRLSSSMSRADQLQAYEDLVKVYEARPEDAQVAHHLALWSLFEADRLEGAAGSRQEIKELRDRAVELSRRMLEQDPSDLDRRLLHLRILLHPKLRLVEEARPIAEHIEADLLENPQPASAVLALVDALPQLDQEVVEQEGPGRSTTRGVLRAQRLLQATIQKQPDSVLFRTVLGRVLAAQDKADAAIEQYARAWELGAHAPAIEALRSYNLQIAAGLEEMDLRMGRYETLDPQQRQELIERAEQRVDEVVRMAGENGMTHLMRGKLAMVRRQFQSAMRRFDQAAEGLAGSPKQIEALLLSARARRMSGERGAAAEQLEKISQRLPGSIPVLLELAQLRLELKQYDQAAALVDQILARDPQDPRARILHAQLLTIRGDNDQAMAVFQSLDAQQYPQILVPMARLYAADGDVDKARELVAQRFDQVPQDVRLLGSLLRMTPNKADQLALIERSRAAGGNPTVLDLLRREAETGHSATREEVVEELIAQQDDPVLRELTLERVHRSQGEDEEADAALARAAKLDPDHPGVVERSFEVAMARQTWDEAARIAARAGSLDLDLAGGAFFRGQLAAARGRTGEAIAEYRRGLAARPVYSDGWRRMGDVQRVAGNLDAAKDAYDRSIDQRPDNTRAIRGLAAVADARGEYDQALRLIKEALRYDSNDAALLDTYLAYELRHGDPGQVLRLRQQLAEIRPEDLENRRALAILLAREQQHDQALATADALLAEDPSLANVQTAAVVQAIAGDIDAGRQTLEQHIANRGDDVTVEDRLALARYLLSADSPDTLDAYARARELEDPQSRPVTREMADLLFARGDNQRAAALYRELHEQDPDDPVVGLRYAETLLRLGDSEQAQALLDRYPDQASGQVLEAAVAMNQEDRAAAIEALQRGLAIDPNNVLAHVQLASLLADDPAQVNRARELLVDALRIAPDSTPARIALAMLHQRLGEIPEAIRELQAVLRRHPEHTAVRLRLVNLHLARSDYPAASALLQEAANREPEAPAWPRLLSQLAQQRGDLTQAVTHARRTVELEPSPANVATLASVLISANQPTQALELLDQHVDLLNAQPALQGIRGLALAKVGQTEQAHRVFTAALQRTSTLAQTLGVAGQVAAAVGPTEAAVLLDSIPESSNKAWMQLATAEMEVRSEQFAQAASRLAPLAGSVDRDADPQSWILLHRLLAMSLHQTGDAQGARRSYERLLHLLPDDVATLNNLAYLLVEKFNETGEGLAMAQRAARIEPDNAQILDTLGWAQFKAGQAGQARETLTRSVEIQPLAPSCYHLARVYESLGVTESARQHAQRAVELARQTNDTGVLPQAEALLAELGS